MAMSGERAIGAVAGDGLPPPAAGWWPSRWAASEVAAGRISRSGLRADGASLYWSESRPEEGGRQVVVGLAPGSPPRVVSPPGVSVRSRVHEYGGGAATGVGGVLFYVDEVDQSWHRHPVDGNLPPVVLGARSGAGREQGTQDPETAELSVRHADARPEPGGRWLITVEERVGDDRTAHR